MTLAQLSDVDVRVLSDVGEVSGGHSEGVTPVPIPNTAVKPLHADGTARETWWESRSLPGLISSLPDVIVGEALLFCAGRIA